MDKGKFRIVISWIFVLLWMAVIISFSSDSADSSKQKSGIILEKVEPVVVKAASKIGIENINTSDLHFLIRKNAHMFNYFVLGILVTNGVSQIVFRNHLRFIFSFAYTVLFASLDEFYQTFIPGRSGELRDVLIDNVGSLIGIIIVICFYRYNIKVENRRRFHL